MLGLPRKSENKPAASLTNGEERQTSESTRRFRRSSHNVLVPTMIGSQMVLVPRPDGGRGLDWPESIPGRE